MRIGVVSYPNLRGRRFRPTSTTTRGRRKRSHIRRSHHLNNRVKSIYNWKWGSTPRERKAKELAEKEIASRAKSKERRRLRDEMESKPSPTVSNKRRRRRTSREELGSAPSRPSQSTTALTTRRREGAIAGRSERGMMRETIERTTATTRRRRREVNLSMSSTSTKWKGSKENFKRPFRD
eukprot:Pompholyxophrys_punicea_v1_NODE_110_length_3422_cov_27.309177.p2 type:complete len:180 gc:universal NODE_110_length_3422_cov_27.309177:750-211(-)